VAPEEVRVLAIHDRPEMTLITCFPFDFIGSAPQRFIVRAHINSIEPAVAGN
jgi:sortase A